ncbi:MAG: FIG056164: rhomboid family serine protease [uncultured Solirubrobacteraceae bacterium]|uniref:FIG056164: rhomboid family serine protease n=1 Tax=uncultured Solirubrobacteraceae bacterium TaxID=1162706 RepID=A0A6J4RPY9_9ACTN|nr:MAG: FIG056164: rhomboid family serine protease [uncultured Solirubrobacteraceae bacterium]
MFPLKDNIPTRRFPVVTVVIIALNVIVYLFVQKKTGIDFSGDSLDPGALTQYAAIPYEVTNPGKECEFAGQQIICEGQPGVSGSAENTLPTWATVFTSMFSHAGLLHLGGNMLFLWIFGNNVEDSMGRVKFVVFYLLGGIAALVGQILIGPEAAVPTLGASGAVAGVLGGYLLLYPRARVVTAIFIVLFFTLIEIPAFLVLGFWFLQQVAFGALDLTNPTGEGGGVAYFAHIGGFVFGLLMIKLFATYRNEAADRPRIPVY